MILATFLVTLLVTILALLVPFPSFPGFITGGMDLLVGAEDGKHPGHDGGKSKS